MERKILKQTKWCKIFIVSTMYTTTLKMAEVPFFIPTNPLIFSNFQIVCGVNKLAKTVSRDGNQVYRYFFDNDAADLDSGKEMNLVLGEPLQALGRRNSDTEIDLSKKLITFWTNFAKFDDPNGEVEVGGEIVWPQYSAPEWSYINVNTDTLEVGEDLRGRVCVFWEQILPGFLPKDPALTERTGRHTDSSCRAVKTKANLYFPGYRPVNRL